MSVRRHEDGTILLEGHCPVEDAEPLLQFLQATPMVPLDWGQCTFLHTAVLQPALGGLGPAGTRGFDSGCRASPFEAFRSFTYSICYIHSFSNPKHYNSARPI